MLKFIFLLLLTVSVSGQELSSEKEAIKSVLFRQLEDWNNGNIGAYMEGYWQSDSLTFVGGKNVTYGWKNTLEKYQKAYPDKEKMGKLSFEIVSLEILPGGYAYMIGKWAIERGESPVSGSFTLLWKKFSSGWLIVSDHSS
ncbi:MAG: nuclear transport factor 2 family protein [Ignavibacteriaceae bacterium]|nr:nuclear transport factor 2 family protein [Ignavibacteriaceae bacterium]